MMASRNHTSTVTPAGAPRRAGVYPPARSSQDRTRSYWVYILASKPGGTLYIGATNDLLRRVHQHNIGKGAAFTRKYGVALLVFAEEHHDIDQAVRGIGFGSDRDPPARPRTGGDRDVVGGVLLGVSLVGLEPHLLSPPQEMAPT